MTAEEFIREKIRAKNHFPENYDMEGLGNYTVTGTDALRWAHEYHQQKVKSFLGDVSNCADIKPPHSKQKKMTEKAERAKYLIGEGYSLREAMKIMGYKSPRSIQNLLKR